MICLTWGADQEDGPQNGTEGGLRGGRQNAKLASFAAALDDPLRPVLFAVSLDPTPRDPWVPRNPRSISAMSRYAGCKKYRKNPNKKWRYHSKIAICGSDSGEGRRNLGVQGRPGGLWREKAKKRGGGGRQKGAAKETSLPLHARLLTTRYSIEIGNV